MAKVKPTPDGFHSITAYLRVRGGDAAIAFYKKAFGAVERFRLTNPDGSLGHAEITIGDSIVMLSDEFPAMNVVSPASLKGTSVALLLYVDDVDAVLKRVTDAGATVLRPIKDQFYGDRSATVIDPFGHEWTIATHVEDVSPEEMDRRAAEFIKQATAG